MIKKYIDGVTLRYIIVGLINTAVGTGIMEIAYNVLNWSYWVSSALNYIIGSTIGYFLSRKFTFKDNAPTGKTVPKYILNIALCYFIAYGMAKPLAKAVLTGFSVKIQENAAMLAGMGIYIALNYIGQRYFVFKKTEK